MSPRRKIDGGYRDYFSWRVPPKLPLRWGLPVTAIITGLVVAVAIAGSVFLLVGHERDRRAGIRDASVLGYARGFITAYTSLDPFNANDYADRIAAQATGDFAKEFKEKENAIVVQVARAEPTTSNVTEAGVQRWTDDGDADVLVSATINNKSRDGKTEIERETRWSLTIVEEGQQWKISNLIQVI
jgi:Mce-associated membrane protein